MNDKIKHLVLACVKDLVPIIMDTVEKRIQDLPDDPIYRGKIMLLVLKVTTIQMLRGMRHPDSKLKNIVREYAEDLYFALNEGEEKE